MVIWGTRKALRMRLLPFGFSDELVLFFLKILFIYFRREQVRERALAVGRSGRRGRSRLLLSRELGARLDPRTLRS